MDLIKSDKTDSLDLPKLEAKFSKTEKSEAQLTTKQGKWRERSVERRLFFSLLQWKLLQLYWILTEHVILVRLAVSPSLPLSLSLSLCVMCVISLGIFLAGFQISNDLIERELSKIEGGLETEHIVALKR